MSRIVSNNKRFVLGTAQFGMKYGIANKTGQPDLKTVEAMIRAAWDGGIREFDTAQAYGESEKTLGIVLKRLGIHGEARVISKIDPELDLLSQGAMKKALKKSLERLGIQKLHGIMLHREELLESSGSALEDIIYEGVASGFVDHIGVSVYSPRGALRALDADGISMVQVPSNVLDRRFEDAGVFETAGRTGKIVYVRSIFLQGLIFVDEEEIPESMAFARPVLNRLHRLAVEFGLHTHDLCVGYVKHALPFAKIIFGAERPEQIVENLAKWERDYPLSLVSEVRGIFQKVEEKILNPALWRS